MEEISKLADSKVISQQEARTVKLAASAAKRKEQLLRSIVEVSLHSAAQDMERLSKSAGQEVPRAEAEAKTRLTILKQILGTAPVPSAAKP